MATKIIHIDMDCFYAAVEIRDNPSLIGKPVAVGATANQRGVLTTCNYEARKYGLHSAMPTARALQLCRDLVLLPVMMEKYRDVSHEIHKVFRRYTNKIEPLSLDEAYLDVSEVEACHGSATLLAKQIRQEICSTVKLTASAGIAPNKFLAKVASDWKKPNGQFLIAPQHIEFFMQTLAVKKIPGVGKVTAQKLMNEGIETCRQLQILSRERLYKKFGKFGNSLYDYCRGIDHRKVEPNRIRKSVSVEHTYLKDLENPLECEHKFPELYVELEKRLRKHMDRKIHKQFIKIKFSDFTQMTKECVVEKLSLENFVLLLHEADANITKSVRLLGLGVRLHDKAVADVSMLQKSLLLE